LQSASRSGSGDERPHSRDIATLQASAITGTGNAQAIRMNLGRLEGEQSRLDFELRHIVKDCK
jgi:hypothetical protein